jgi:biopolymer transport protein ExbB/TolQ
VALIVSFACPPARGREAPDEFDTRIVEGEDLQLPEVIRAGGRMMTVLLVLSVGTVAVAIFCFVDCGRRRVMPDACHQEIMTLARGGGVDKMSEPLARTKSLYARAVGAALGARGKDVAGAARSSGERDAAILRGRLNYLPALAALSAALGILGTLGGLIQSFGAAAHERFHYGLVYAGVMKALVVSFFGVGIAIFALAVFYLLRGRAERSLADAAFAVEEVVRIVQSSSEGAERQ